MDGVTHPEFTSNCLAQNRVCKYRQLFIFSNEAKHYKQNTMKQPVEGKVLGKSVAYPQTYSPQILVAVPRSLNREIYKLDSAALPFCGQDVWHAYELSFLTQKGLPVTGVLKLVYPAHSEFLVESKSLKLYLNSFNMERFGDTPAEGIQMVLDVIGKDLKLLLKIPIKIGFFDHNSELLPYDFNDFELLEAAEEVSRLHFESFIETPALLTTATTPETEMRVGTHLLRSNCKITFQPDWGSAFIFMKGPKLPQRKGLLQYLVSIRNENHFHEEICEMIYKRLWDQFSPEQLMVTCIYTRRGGIDICPARASHPDLLPQNLINPNQLSLKLLRQ